MSELLIHILTIASGVLAVLALVFFVWFAARFRTLRKWRGCVQSASAHCPSPHIAWWVTLLLVHRWFIRNACWYDLTAHAADADGNVRCPECGIIIPRDRVLHPSQRFRCGRLACFLFLASVTCLGIVASQDDRWLHWTPDYALVMFERAGSPWQSTKLRRELDRRVYEHEIVGRIARMLADSLIHDLRDDDVRWNAYRAVSRLEQLGESSRDALRRAMQSDDWQERQYAFIAFRYCGDENEVLPFAPEAIDVAIEALRDDGERSYRNAIVGYRYLLHHIDRQDVRFPVRKTMRATDDPQQRLLCALICAFANIDESLPDTFPILIDCLRDNRVSGDALAAAPALFAYGEPVIPLLLKARKRTTDRQQILIIDLILFDLGVSTEYEKRTDITRYLPWRFGYPFVDRAGASAIVASDALWLDDYAFEQRRRQTSRQ